MFSLLSFVVCSISFRFNYIYFILGSSKMDSYNLLDIEFRYLLIKKMKKNKVAQFLGIFAKDE